MRLDFDSFVVNVSATTVICTYRHTLPLHAARPICADARAEINMLPPVRGSMTEFAGQRGDELAELPEGAWVLRGDRGLTYSPALPNGSELVGGAWWAADYKGPPLVSVEQEVATSLGLKIGDTLSVNVLGVEIGRAHV